MGKRVARLADGLPAAEGRDTTEELRAMIAALDAERLRLREVLEVLPAYVLLLTPDYHVPFANGLFRERYGEFEGRRCYEHLFKRSEPCEGCQTHEVLNTGQPVRWVWAGPDDRIYDVYDYPFTDSDGSRLILEVGIDTTERRQAEAEVRKLNAELEQRVAARTRELSEANERLQDVLRAVGHDLRNPLAGIQGQAQLLQRRLQRGMPVETLLANADALLASVRRMNTMIGDLVDSERARSGQLHLDSQPIDLPAFVEKLKLDEAAALDTARIEVEATEPLPPVSADPRRLQRILVNLLSNALKYSDQGTPVTVHFQRRSGEVVTLITDRGRGIAPEDMQRIFERYFRSEAASLRREGIGLGLYITRQLVDAHGGHMWVESEPGVGSTFSFSLPIDSE